jgi:hypothetical protein
MKDSWFRGSVRSALCDLTSLRSGCRRGGTKDSSGCAIGLERVSSAFLFGSGGVCFEKTLLVVEKALGSRVGVCSTASKQDVRFVASHVSRGVGWRLDVLVKSLTSSSVT